MRTFLLLSFLSLSFIFTGYSQSKYKRLKPQQMQKDFNTLLETLEAHPDPYTKISQDSFNLMVDDITKNISQELDELDYYKELSRLIALIEDGHSRIYMPKSWLDKRRKENGALPFKVFLSDNLELYIIESYDTDQFKNGTQILEIDGLSIETFINKINPFIAYELKPYRNDKISRSFEFYLYLWFKKVNALPLKTKYTEEKIQTIETIDYKEWKKLKKDNREIREENIKKGKPYDFNIIRPGVAKIDIFSFSANLKNYKIFLHDTFKKVKSKNIHSLIIDVRGNYGGWPKIASELFHYIHEGHFKTQAKSSTKISGSYRKHLISQNPNRKRHDARFLKKRHYIDLENVIFGKLNTYSNEESFFNESPRTEKHEFSGECYLLIDRRSYSAASSFASTFQCYNIGLIIGEPTGGTKIFRANPINVKLPKTGFVFRVSTTKLYNACYNEENQAVTPNLEVVPSINERVHKVDSQLNATLMLINKLRKQEKEKNN